MWGWGRRSRKDVLPEGPEQGRVRPPPPIASNSPHPLKIDSAMAARDSPRTADRRHRGNPCIDQEGESNRKTAVPNQALTFTPLVGSPESWMSDLISLCDGQANRLVRDYQRSETRGEDMAQDPAFWRLRGTLPPEARVAVRRTVDHVAGGILGSVRGATETRRIALTLDDGPDPVVTPEILRLLHERSVHATFFVLVENARGHGDLIRGMISDGHDVGLHGIDHRPVRGMSYREARDYIRRGKCELEAVAQSPISLFRPTFGAQSVPSYWAARAAGLDVVVWTTDVRDWEPRDCQEVVSDALRTPDGGVLLFHDRLEGWANRMPKEVGLDRPLTLAAIVDGWREQGRTASSVTELVRSGNPHRSVWFRP